MYCSSSGTANIHVFARLSSAARPLPAVPQQPAHPPELLTEPQRREFILERCTGVAAHLIQAATFAAWQSELQQQGLLDSRPGGFMVMLLRRMAHQPEDTETAATVRSILNSCSTEGRTRLSGKDCLNAFVMRQSHGKRCWISQVIASALRLMSI